MRIAQRAHAVIFPRYSGRLWRHFLQIRKRAVWFDADSALPTFQSLQTHLKQNSDAIKPPNKFTEPDFRTMLMEELQDCFEKLKAFAAVKEPFHLSIVA
jgi:hypothetical protein